MGSPPTLGSTWLALQNGVRYSLAMLATLGGYLALLLGLAVLLLPLLATELSRPRDSAWGALVLLLGLVLVTTAERLNGAPMLGVLCGGLLIGRLGLEVGQGRWRLLSAEEQQRLWSKERWQTSLSQAGRAGSQLLAQLSQLSAGLASWMSERRQSRPTTTKRWVRPEADANAAPQDGEPTAAEPPSATGEGLGSAGPTHDQPGLAEQLNAKEDEVESEAEEPAAAPALIEVSSFDEIDALLEAASADATKPLPAEPHSEAG